MPFGDWMAMKSKLKMKKTVLLFALCVIGFTLSANAQNLTDVVYLKNGSIIKGVIVEQIPNESLKIETRDGNIFFYKMSEIEKLTRETVNNKATNRRNSDYVQSKFNKPQGYLGILEIGGGLGVGNWAADRISLNIINGYRFMPQFAIGLGVGLETFMYTVPDWDYGKYSDIVIPVFLHLRSDFIDGKVSPYAAFNIGYNILLDGNFFEGLRLEPTLGVSFNVGRKRMMAGLSFVMDRVAYAIDSSGYYYRDTAMGHALKLKFGFSF
jgi:hypothetical protein